ncbi:hypothetical protein D3C73_1239630 [compost metagenome]
MAKRFIKITNRNTPNPNAKFIRLPKLGSCTLPPPRSVNATGIKVTPIIVTTDPVTTGGKNAINLPNRPANRNTKRPEAMIAP